MVSVRCFLAYRFLAACLPYLPVASLCLSARGLGWDQVLQLGALYAIASAALVLPVSALAQRIGTRRTLIGGAVATAVGAVLAAIATDVATLAIAQIAFAVAAAVDSGADSAYLWTLLSDDRAAYRHAEARGAAVKLAGGVAGIALGGALLAWSPAAPFAAAAGFALAAAACALRLPETTLPAEPVRALPAAARALVTAAGGARWLVIAVVSCAVARVLASAIGPLLADAGVTTSTASAIATAAALVAAAAVALSGALHATSRRIALFVAAPVGLAAIAVGLAVAHGAAAMALVAVLPVFAALVGPLWRAHLNQHAPAGAPRLTMLALDATLVRIVAAVLPLVVTAGAGPRAGVTALGLVLLAVIGGVAAGVVLRDRKLRLVAIAAAALALPQLAGADAVPARPVPAWAAPAAICTDPLVVDKPLGQGTTIKFRGRAGAAKVVLRPEQTLAAGNFRADVAAHRLATALGTDAVPYGCLRRIDRAALEAVAPPALLARLATEVTWAADGTTLVSVVAWVDGVKPAGLEANRAQWSALLRQSAPLAGDAALRAAAAEGSRLAVWDFLIANWDRWSGGNTFRLGAAGDFEPSAERSEAGPERGAERSEASGPPRGEARQYVWLDNAAGFGLERARTRATRGARFAAATERFSRTQIAALRGLDGAGVRAALADAGLAEARVAEVIARRDMILAHVAALIAAHGEDAVLAFE